MDHQLLIPFIFPYTSDHSQGLRCFHILRGCLNSRSLLLGLLACFRRRVVLGTHGRVGILKGSLRELLPAFLALHQLNSLHVFLHWFLNRLFNHGRRWRRWWRWFFNFHFNRSLLLNGFQVLLGFHGSHTGSSLLHNSNGFRLRWFNR